MSPVRGIDNHTEFIPIKQDNNLSKPIHGDSHDGLNPTATDGQSHFDKILQALLEKIMANRSNLSGTGTNHSGGNLDSFPSILSGSGQNGLLSLGQTEETDALPTGSSQTVSLQLLQSLMELAKDENSGNNRPVTEIPYAQMITKYKQAMNDFRNAFNLLPAKSSDGLSINTINRILHGETGIVGNVTAMGATGVNPSKQEVADYITGQCRAIGLPDQLGLATATTESDLTQFNKDGAPLCGSNTDSADWGIMQINDKAWGDTFDMNRIKTDWKYNIRAGLQILKESYDAALRNNEESKGSNSNMENLARAAYSGYNAGTGNIWRYRTAFDHAPKTGPYDVISDEGFDIRDIRFWNNYQKFI
jgi:hypothetical protein